MNTWKSLGQSEQQGFVRRFRQGCNLHCGSEYKAPAAAVASAAGSR